MNTNPIDTEQVYPVQDITPEQEAHGRKKLDLPPRYVERLHVQGLLWKIETQVKELTASNEAPSALEALVWVTAGLRKLEGKE